MDTQQQKLCNILLIGDSCIDKFHYGVCDRISPEAPVPVLVHKETIPTGGMVENVKSNLLTFGTERIKITCISNTEKITKERFIDTASGQHILRFDSGEEVEIKPLDYNHKEIENISKYDLVVISDYNKGFITEDVSRKICKECLLYDIPVFVDTKKRNIECFTGAIVKINQKEFNNLNCNFPMNQIIITRGSLGAHWNGCDFSTKSAQVLDVSGAGDTFLAVLAYKYFESKRDIEVSIKFANLAASYSVQKSGTYALKEEDIEKLCF